MKIKCIIVDDEPLARRVLKKYINEIPYLELVHQCHNAIEATSYLHDHNVDVIFLDIKMPQLSGLDFLKTLEHPPKIILTTAYSDYALEGYEYSVLDYLLKPISFKRFLKAVNKIHLDENQNHLHNSETANNNKDDFIFLHADKIDHKMLFSDIRFIEACGNFVQVYTATKKITASATMTTIESTLPQERFIRVHKSYIVSIDEITQIEGNMIQLKDRAIPIGRHYRINVEKMLSTHKIHK